MSVKIRLKRMGMKKHPFYRVIVADERSPRDGRFIEQIGTYDPMKQPSEINIDSEKAAKWLKNGAQPTDTVRTLLQQTGVLEKPVYDNAEKTADSQETPHEEAAESEEKKSPEAATEEA